jgi:hypothetical protein
MNNIENSIRHLQSSIDIRSNRLTVIHGLVVEYIGDYKNALKDGNTSLAKDYKHEINSWKAAIVKDVKQQKIEKKMLAMIYGLQNHKNNSWGWTGNQLAKALDNI